jgi:metal-responsive CopG/Arc/MetJ family transcriptional regulator
LSEKIKTSISLDKEVYDKIQEMAIADDRNFSQFVNKILKEYLNQKE